MFAGNPRAQEAKRTVFAVPDSSAPTGTTDVEDFVNGITASAYARPCYDEFD